MQKNLFQGCLYHLVEPARILEGNHQVWVSGYLLNYFFSTLMEETNLFVSLDPDFLPIPDPGSRGQNGTGSRIRIRNTDGRAKLRMAALVAKPNGGKFKFLLVVLQDKV